MPTLGFTDNDGIDVGNKYITKDYAMTTYPNLFTNVNMPALWSAGHNNTGQIGDGTTVSKSSPVFISSAVGSFGWRQIAVSEINGTTNGYAAGIKTDGTLWTWGSNGQGQLGNNTVTNRSSPVTTAGGGTNWSQVACGYNHSGGIKSDGSLWMWGSNAAQQLGTAQAASVSRSSPITTAGAGTTWKQLSLGFNNSAAVKTDGTLWVWGDNSDSALGDGGATSRSSPSTTAGAGTNWVQVSMSRGGGAGVKSDGTLWTWGRNRQGRLGDNFSTTTRTSPNTTAIGGTTWKNVVTTRFNTYATKTDGTLWAWGDNGSGQLGDNTVVAKSSPIQVGGATSWRAVFARSDSGSTSASGTAAAIKTDGTLWTWGINVRGQLGDNTVAAKSSPITGLIGGWGTWKTAACGYTNILSVNEADSW